MIREVPTTADGAKRLVAYLKEQPSGAKRPARELAKEFGLEPLFISQVLRGLQATQRTDPLAPFRKPAMAMWNAGKNLGEWLKTHTTLVVVGTIYLALLVFLIQVMHLRNGHLEFTVKGSLQNAGILYVEAIVLHCLMYFLAGDLRVVLTGTANLAISLTAMLSVVATGQSQSGDKQLPVTWIVLVVATVSAIYGVAGGLSAGFGALWQFHKQDEIEAQYSRQQLLERLFQLETRLAATRESAFELRQLFPGWLTKVFQRYPWRSPVVFGIIYGFSQLLVGSEGAFSLMGFGISLLGAAVYVTIGYVSDRPQVAISRATLAYGTSFLFKLIPWRGYGLVSLFGEGAVVLLAAKLATSCMMSGLGYLIHLLEERMNIRSRLEAGDPAALLAEIVRIEWRLSAKSQEVVLVSVDAAKSAEMKAACDPLVAEYSFREYQDFLRLICTSNGGFVHSTAGDGAILAFPDCEKAFRAAREIQTGISYFNEHVNRMQAKFRLRIGIHMGETADDVREVQYTEVIDIAAHVQGVAPIRGIVVTKPVATHLVNEHLIPLREPVDGYEVFLAYNPTVEM